MLDLNRFITTDPRGCILLCAKITSKIAMNEACWRVPCDLTTLFNAAASAWAWCTHFDAIARPMAKACFYVNDERPIPTAVVGIVALVPSSGRPCTSALSNRASISPMCAKPQPRGTVRSALQFCDSRGDLGDPEGPAVLARTPFDAAATFVQFALSAYPNVIQIICSLIAVSFHTTLANRLPRTRLRLEDPLEPFLLESIDS